MTEFPILQSLGSILFAAAAAVLLLRRFRVPTIVAYMAAGIVLGPVAGLVEVTDSIELISRVGIALLLFLVGLQLSLDSVRDVLRTVIVSGVTQVLGTFAFTFALVLALGQSVAAAAVLALATACTSTVVMVKLLGERREHASRHGRIALGISMVQDLTTILALTALAGVGAAAQSADGGGELRSLAVAFGGMFGLMLLAGGAARFVLPGLFARVERSSETTFIWSLAWCFLFIAVAEAVGLSVELGAFIAGLSLASLHFADDMRRRVQPIVHFFLAAFFVSLGLQMQPLEALARWPLMLALIVATIVVKPAIVFVTLARLRTEPRTTFMTGLLQGQMSEFSFILAALTFSMGIIDGATLSVVTLSGFITIGLAAYAALHAERVEAWLRKHRMLHLSRVRREARTEDSAPRGGHVIVVGMNTLGRLLVRSLQERGIDVVAVDTDAVKLQDLGCTTLLGSVDDLDVLEQAHAGRARLVISALQIEDTNNLLAYRCRQLGVPSAIHAFDTSVIDELREIGVDHLIVPKHDGTRRMALMLRSAGVLD